MRTEREKQVARALAAERRRTVDEEVAYYRRLVKRAIPWVMVLNVVVMGFEIWHGVYGAIAANLSVLPMLWLSRWLVIVAEHREHEQQTQIGDFKTASDAVTSMATTRTTIPGHLVSSAHTTVDDWDCDAHGHIFTMGSGTCLHCGAAHDPPCTCPLYLKTTYGTFDCPFHGTVKGELKSAWDLPESPDDIPF